MRVKMEATTSSIIKQLEISLEPLKNLNKSFILSPEFWGSIIASITALFIALGGAKFIKPRIGIKPKLDIVNLERYRQVTYYWRLAIKNTGNEVAKNVQVDVTKVLDDGGERKNFLAVPLRWTHLNSEQRDILPEQTAYLDVLEHIASKNEAKLITRFGGGVKDFEEIRTGKSTITLTFYQKNGTSFNKKIIIKWSTGMFLDCKVEGKKWLLSKNGEFF